MNHRLAQEDYAGHIESDRCILHMVASEPFVKALVAYS